MPARTQALTETAFLAALTAVLFFLAQIPLIGPFLCLGCPFPLTLMVHRHGGRQGLVGALAALLVVALMQGYLALLAVPFVVVGLSTGLMARRRWPPLACIGWGGLGMGLLLTGLTWAYENLYAARWGLRPLRDSWVDLVGRSLDGVTGSAGLQEYLVRIGYAVSWMPLAVALLLGLLGFWLYYQAARPVLVRFQVPLAPLPAFASWRAPGILTLLVVLVLVLDRVPGSLEALRPAQGPHFPLLLVIQLEVLLEAFYALMGAAVLDAVLARGGLPWPLRRLLELLALGLPLPGGLRGYSLLGLVGLLDPVLDLRGRMHSGREKTLAPGDGIS